MVLVYDIHVVFTLWQRALNLSYSAEAPPGNELVWNVPVNWRMVRVEEVEDDVVIWLACTGSWVVTLRECLASDVEFLFNWIVDNDSLLPDFSFVFDHCVVILASESNIGFGEELDEVVVWHPEYAIISHFQVHLLLKVISPLSVIVIPWTFVLLFAPWVAYLGKSDLCSIWFDEIFHIKECVCVARNEALDSSWNSVAAACSSWEVIFSPELVYFFKSP